MLVLLLIGLVHGLLVWWGDILASYAICGFALILFRKRTQRTVMIWAQIMYWILPLILVGFYMMSVVREIAWDDYDTAVPAFVTMLAMPFTWSITNGIGAGFITYAVLKLLNGKGVGCTG